MSLILSLILGIELIIFKIALTFSLILFICSFILLCLNNNINSNGYDEENYEDFLQGLNDEFKDDKEIVIASIKKCCKNIIHCSKRLRNDKDVILTAINNCYYDFYDDMREDDKITNIKERTKNIDIILKKTKLKNDPDILKQVIKKIRIC